MGLLDKMPPTKRAGGSIESGKMTQPQGRIAKVTPKGNGKSIKAGPKPKSVK